MFTSPPAWGCVHFLQQAAADATTASDSLAAAEVKYTTLEASLRAAEFAAEEAQAREATHAKAVLDAESRLAEAEARAQVLFCFVVY